MSMDRPHRPTVVPHPRLKEVVLRHLSTAWMQPIRAHTQWAFDQVHAAIQSTPHRVILDSGCGTGQSTQRLAQAHPDHWVVGVDRSAHRLAKAGCDEPNAMFVRAELSDFWRLVVSAQWPVEAHHVLYPNPYPKAVHLKKRWHGHPVWPVLLAVGERLTMRTNSCVFAKEWRLALHWSKQADIDCAVLSPDTLKDHAWSAFEHKYAMRGQPLYEVTSRRQPIEPCPQITPSGDLR